ncbi:MAG: helix-turn-helix domain-containing protein [Patescibacteria group bacterium]
MNIPPARRKHLDFNIDLKEKLQDPEFRKEFEKLQPEFELIRALVDARAKKGITQKILAKKMGTKQSVISRLESGRANPTLAFLKKLATALNTRLEIRFTSPQQTK